MSNFIINEIGTLVEIYNGSTPDSSKSEYWGGYIPWITPKDLSTNKSKYISRGSRNITNLGLSKIGNKLLPIGTILFSSRAPIGLISITQKELTTNQGFKNLVCKPDKIHNEYLYYLLKTKIDEISALGTGTTFKEISKASLEKFKIKHHYDLTSQQEIASFLKLIDSKIDISNQIIYQVNKISNLLYNYWFIQFEFPDENGKPYKSSGGKMVYNEYLKREIPEGWELRNLGDICNTSLGGTPSTGKLEYWDGEINWLNSGEISNFPIVKSTKKITPAGVRNSATEVLAKGTVLISITRHLRVTILGIDACVNQSVIGIKENEKFKNSFLYLFMKNELPRLLNLRTGAQQPHLNKDIIDNSPIVIPKKDVLDNFYLHVNNIFEQIICSAKQIQELENLRDWLLPMLINGQVKVGDMQMVPKQIPPTV